MLPNLTAPFRKALYQLEAEKQRIDREIAAIRAALEVLGDKSRRASRSGTLAKTKQRQMSAAARRAVSQRMKEYWAKRRAGAGKSKARGTHKAK